jgi:hypothetical protein
VTRFPTPLLRLRAIIDDDAERVSGLKARYP